MEKIALTEFISSLREDLQLSIASTAAFDPALKFTLTDIELDLEVVATKVAEASGGIAAKFKFFVVSSLDADVRGKASSTTATTQRVKLKLTPLLHNNDRKKTNLSASQETSSHLNKRKH